MTSIDLILPAEGEFGSSDAVLDRVNTALRQMMIPEETERFGKIFPKYKAAVVILTF